MKAQAKTIAVVANGSIQNLDFIYSKIQTYEQVIAVDGGLNYCAEMNIVPDLIIGDFDSVNPEILSHYPQVPIKRYPIDKDKTDLELAIESINHIDVTKIGVFGALGNRIDHMLSNLQLIRRFPPHIYFETETETLFMVKDEMTIRCKAGQTVSLICIGENARGVTTQGLKWELKQAVISKDFYSVSNKCLSDSFSIKIEEGDLICCLVNYSLDCGK